MAEQKFINLSNVKRVWENLARKIEQKIDETYDTLSGAIKTVGIKKEGNNLIFNYSTIDKKSVKKSVPNIDSIYKIEGNANDLPKIEELKKSKGSIICIENPITIEVSKWVNVNDNNDIVYTIPGVEELQRWEGVAYEDKDFEIKRGDGFAVDNGVLFNADNGQEYSFGGRVVKENIEKGTYISTDDGLCIIKDPKKYAEISNLAKINGKSIYNTSNVILNDNHIKTQNAQNGISDNFQTDVNSNTSLSDFNQILLNNDCFLNKKFEDYTTLSTLNTTIYNNISLANEFNSIKNGAVVNVTQPIKIGEEVFAIGTYVKSNDTLVSINAPKVVDVDLTEYMRLNDLENSRNYAKGTGYSFKLTQAELGSYNNKGINDGNCFIYPISGLKKGDVVTVSFDWYFCSGHDSLKGAFYIYEEITKDKDKNTSLSWTLGTEYDYSGGPIISKNNYEQYKISDNEAKGHYVGTLSIGNPKLNTIIDEQTVSYPYIQNQYIGNTGRDYYFEISNFMVVKGEKELPWKPAPEDSYDFPYNIPWANNSKMKIMPGLYNVLGKDSTINNISCGFRQLANTNKLISKYTFEWTAGSNGTTLTLPADIKWLNNETPTFEAYQKYKVIVENNFAKCEKGGYQYYKDFSFANGKFYEVNYERDSWLYWQTDNGEGIYTENFGLNKNNDTFQYRVYVDSSLSEEYLPGGDNMGFTFEYSSTGDHILTSNDGIPKKYHLLKPNTGLYKKDNNGYVSMIFATD